MTESKGAAAPESFTKRVLLVCFAMVQITLAAGLIVGWPGIAGSMLVEPMATGGAGLTLDQTTQLYSLAAAVNYVAPLFLGLVLDNFGPRACSFLSNAIVAVGLAIFAMSKTFVTFAIGICFVAFGGPSAQQSLLHIGNMFGERRFFVMGMVAESITLSFAVFPLMDIAWENIPADYGFRVLFAGLGVVVVCSSIGSLLLWPDAPYEIFVSKDPSTKADEEDDDKVLLVGEEKVANIETIIDDLKTKTFAEQLTSGVYIRLGVFFTVTSWLANFYIATVTTELGDQQIFDAETQHSLTRWLSFLDAGAIIAAPLSGYLLESVGFTPTAIITISLGVIQQLCLLFAGSNTFIMIVSFATYAVYRAFLFPYFFASLSRKMGFRFFGFLSGISFCVSGFTQFGVAPVALLVEGDCHDFVIGDPSGVGCAEGSWVAMHWIQVGILLLLLLIPFFDTQAEKKANTKSLKLEETASLSAHSTEYGSI